MIVENFVASIVSNLLSIAGLSAIANGCFIRVPFLNHTFVVTLSCIDLVGIFIQTSMYIFVVWVYVAANGFSIKPRTYSVLGLIGFIAFFSSNILRMFTEIFLLGKVYVSTHQYYLLHWQAFEEQIGLGLMFVTLSILSILSYLFFKRRMTKHFIFEKPKNEPLGYI